MHRFSIRDKIECGIDKWATSIYCSFTQGHLIIDVGEGGGQIPPKRISNI